MKDMNPFGEPLPENRAALEVKEDGQIWLNDGRQSILVSDQEVAKELIWTERTGLPFAEPITIKPGIYPIPGLKWEAKNDCELWCSDCKAFDWSTCKERLTAVISLPEPDKEKRKKLLIEMMQEDEKYGMYEKSDNELIAEFMGVKEQQGFYDSYGQDEPFWYTANEHFRTHSRSIPDLSFDEFMEHCKYHTSWDWLMPVVEKISRIRCAPLSDVDYSTYHPRTFGMLDTEGKPMVRIHAHGVFTGDTLIQAAYDAVVDFVKLYNQQSK